MKYLIILIVALLSTTALFHSTASADEQAPTAPTEIKQYLDQRGLQLTITAADIKKNGYILVLGTARGERLAAKRAATVSAQRAIESLLAELPADSGKASKQIVKTPPVTKRRVSGKLRQAKPIFSHYDSSNETFYLLLQKQATAP